MISKVPTRGVDTAKTILDLLCQARTERVLVQNKETYRKWFEFAHHTLGLLEDVNIDCITEEEAYVYALMKEGKFFCPLKDKEELAKYLITHFKDIKLEIALSAYKLYTGLYLLFQPTPDANYINFTGYTRPLSMFTIEKIKMLKCIQKQYKVCDNIPDYEWNNLEMMIDSMFRMEELNSTKHKLNLINQYHTIEDTNPYYKGGISRNTDDEYKNTNFLVYDERSSFDLKEVADVIGFFINVREFDLTDNEDVKALYELTSGKRFKIALSLLGMLYFLTYDVYPYNRSFGQQLEAKAWMDQLPSYAPNCVVMYKDLSEPIKKYKNAMYDKPSRNDDSSITYLYWLYCILSDWQE